MQDVRDALRGMGVLRELPAAEAKEGLRVGDDCRIYKDKDKGIVVRFLKGTDEKRKKQVREKLDMGNVKYTEGKEYKD